MAWHIHEQRLQLHPPDILLRPDVSSYGSLDFTDVEGPYLAGKQEAERYLESIMNLVTDH